MDNRPWWQRKRYGLLLLVSTYLLCGFFLVPEVAERRIERFAADQLELGGDVADASFNPLTYRFELTAARFSDGEQPVLGLDALIVNFDPLASLFNWGWSFSAIELHAPYVYIHAFEDGRFNWQDILARRPAPDTQAAPATEAPNLPRMQLAQFRIARGVIEYREDRATDAYHQEITPIDLSLASFSTLPENTGPYRLTAVTESGATIRWTGQLGVQPVRLEGEAAIGDAQLAEIGRYFGPEAALRLDEGTLSLQTQYRIELAPRPLVILSDGHVQIVNPVLRDPTAAAAAPPLFQATRLVIDGLRARGPTEPAVAAAAVALDDPHLQAILEPDGQLNWVRLLIDPESEDPEPPISVDRITLTSGAVDWIDRTHPAAATVPLRELSIGVQSVALPPSGQWPFNVATRIGADDPGQLQMAGTWNADSGELRTELDIQSLPLSLSNAYLADFVSAGWSGGTLVFSGQVEAAQEPAAVQLAGKLGLAGAELVDTRGDPVVAWEDLSIDQVSLGWPGATLALDDITWQSPHVRLLIEKGYETNIGSLFAEAAPDPADQEQTPPVDGGEPSWALAAGPIGVRAATMDFEDRNVPGNFKAAIHELSGNIGKLNSAAAQSVPIALAGKANEQGSLDIDGTVALFGEQLAADVTMNFANLALVPLSPYAIKFAGYRIDQGKLALEMHYDISDGQLSGSNHAVLDQFQLGEKVPSESAISAPIELAVALLKNDQGIIDIEIPVSGDLANPEFSIGGVIRQAIGSAIGGIVSAPFRFLASLVGGREEDLQQVGFSAGASTLDAMASANLEKLAEALRQRPQLRLEIRPGWSPADREVLTREALAARIESAGGNPQALQSSRPAIEQVFVESFSEADRLALETEHTVAPTEADPGGLNEPTYVQAMHERLLEQTSVGDEELALLANARADQVSAAMQELGVDPQRLFVLDVQQLEDGESERVQLPLAVSG